MSALATLRKNNLKNGIMIFIGPGSPFVVNDCVIKVDALPGNTIFTLTFSDSNLLESAIDMPSKMLFE